MAMIRELIQSNSMFKTKTDIWDIKMTSIVWIRPIAIIEMTPQNCCYNVQNVKTGCQDIVTRVTFRDKPDNPSDCESLTLFEPPHDKTSKMTFAPSEDSDQPDQRLRCPQLPMERTIKTVSRLDGWPVWSEFADHFVGFVMRRLILYL